MPNHDGTGPNQQQASCQSNRSSGMADALRKGFGGHRQGQCCGKRGSGLGQRKNGQNNG